ncbi:putative ecdysone oxidase [Operophtera brumata]|uniref:Putative ecdysone oxidase n=1 Tax=Operophtera brumata TaxID=104452 RepID=A0A0L7LP50_OPEBR|nr:putative ecdysone oxidase [Operophtera brumata]
MSDLKVDFVKNRLLGEEEKKNKHKQFKNQTYSNSFLCFNCGKAGHKKYQCSQVQGHTQGRGHSQGHSTYVQNRTINHQGQGRGYNIGREQSYNIGRGLGYNAGRGLGYNSGRQGYNSGRGTVYNSGRGFNPGQGRGYPDRRDHQAFGAENQVSDVALQCASANSEVNNCNGKIISWCVDSGCSDHLVKSRDYFTDYIELKVPKNIAAAKNGVMIEAVGIELRKNLLSVSKMESSGLEVSFYKGKIPNENIEDKDSIQNLSQGPEESEKGRAERKRQKPVWYKDYVINLNDENDKALYALLQAHKTKTVHMTRGKMLGGSSAANYMFYVRGNREDYQRWAALGHEGWDWDNVTHYFMKSERLNDVAILRSSSANLHGLDGYLGISKPFWKSTQRYLDAFRENGHDILADSNGHHQLGYSMPQFTIDQNIRQSTAAAFLSPITRRKNLLVLKCSIGRRVIFDGNKRAVGMEVRLPDRRIVTLRARKEVILSAGAINSPQILMASGIGPKDHLESLGIDVLLDSPSVGANLIDHPIVPVALAGGDDFSSIVENLDLLTNLDKFPTPSLTGYVALNVSQTYPDYQSTVFPFPVFSPLPALYCAFVIGLDDDICVALDKATKSRRTILSVLSLLHPQSRGRVRLQSKDPEVKPLIYSGYYSNENDLENHARYIEHYIAVINTTYFKSVGGFVIDMQIPQCKELVFGSGEYWKCHVLSVSTTQWHAAGTCAMGSVLDGELRVRGVRGLRVVDASVTPASISGNLNAPIKPIQIPKHEPKALPNNPSI